MDNWPQQASDTELGEAEQLNDRLCAAGLWPVYAHNLTNGNNDAMITERGVGVGLDRIGFKGARYEPSGITQVADVTQVSGELWVPVWLYPAVIAATRYAAGMKRPDTDRANFRGRDYYGTEVLQRQADNIEPFSVYMRAALSVLEPDPVLRDAVVALWLMQPDTLAVHTLLFPEGGPP